MTSMLSCASIATDLNLIGYDSLDVNVMHYEDKYKFCLLNNINTPLSFTLN